MAEVTVGVSCLVDVGGAVLVEEVAGEVPTHPVPFVGDAGAVGWCDDIDALLVDDLKEEGAVHAADVEALVEGVGVFFDAGCTRMLEAVHGVVPAVEDHRAAGDGAGLEAEFLIAADGLGEAKGEEADKGHEHGADAEHTTLFFESQLALFGFVAAESR